jgi:copper chaperone
MPNIDVNASASNSNEVRRPIADGGVPISEGRRPTAEGPRPLAEGPRLTAGGGVPISEGPRPKAEGRPVMVVLDVQGMTCGSCEKHVGEALATVPGVSEVSVSRRTSSATIAWATSVPDVDALIDAVLAAGYDASVARVAGDIEIPAAPEGVGCSCGCEVSA